MKAGDILKGFRVLSASDVAEYRCQALHLMHDATGCEVFNLSADDRENLFAFSFMTPPPNDTGVTHITEHSVLSGSRRFTVKEPFSVLMKGSMHTFLNAFTFPDRTVYPAASLNHADYFNLMLVYGDAVFFPLLRTETFMQEAWRLERQGEILKYAGVVYNEMKGAYSSPESVVGEWAYRSLFPDTPYRFDSGGDPKAIPSLALSDLKSYHARYYHPSNCRIFLYGNIPVEEKLEFLQRQLLASFGREAAAEPLPPQSRWESERRLEKTFPVRPGTPTEKRSTVCMSWLSQPVTDPLALLTLEVLCDILIANAGSPLRKRLVDSGLGEDLSPASGLETELLQSVFCVGLRGTQPDREGEIRGLILDTLSSLCRDGIDPSLIESVINRVEFRNREIRGGGGPYALRLMRRTLRGWSYGLDPAASLAFTPVMERLREELSEDPKYFEGVIERELLSNQHRVVLVVRPDPDQEKSESEELSRHLAALSAGIDPEGRRKLEADAEAFTAFQKRAENPEELAKIPFLARKDLPAAVEKIPTLEQSLPGGVPLFLHDIFTNGIAYIDILFPLEGLDEGLSLLLPLFCKAVCGSGVPGVSYADMAVELFRLTGGFFSSVDASGIVGSRNGIGQNMLFRVKALWKNLVPALDLVRRLLLSADFADESRLRDMILELRNDEKSSLVPAGHHFALLRAAARLCPSAAREETWKGVTQLVFLEELASHVDERLSGVREGLEKIRDSLVRRGRMILNATAPGEGFGQLASALGEFSSSIPDPRMAHPAEARPAFSPTGGGAESLVTSATVGYVARAITGIFYQEPKSAAQTVLGHLLSTGHLWESVRMEGGAYGAFSYPRSVDGVFLFASYRDPNIVRTLGAFREALARAADGGLDEKDIDRAVIGTVGKEERPMDPSEKGLVGLQRRLYGITDELRQSHRSRVLGMDRTSLVEAARILLDGYEKGFSVVISNRAAIERAGREMAELAASVREIPE